MLDFAGYTRRSLFRLGASLLLNGAANRTLALGRFSALEQVAHSLALDTAIWHYRQYVVHATIMLGSIPIFSKQNVGGAAVALEAADENAYTVTALQLTAGSSPERLKGFNRFGATQEIVREEKGVVKESAYVSFMATSREKGLADARKAFVAQAGKQMFTVARGRATAAGCTSGLEHRALDLKYTWCNCVDLLDELETGNPLPAERPVANYGPGCLPTFLFAVRRATQKNADGASNYIHNGEVFRLRTQIKMDQNSGQRIITGWTSEIGERSEAEFKIWLANDDATALPVKIEFHPRAFLKLTLEADQSAHTPALQPVLGRSAS